MFTPLDNVTAIVQRPRLIALDLDGTLLPESKQLTARSRAALRAMEELGTTITLATGKFLHLADRYGEELGLAHRWWRSTARGWGQRARGDRELHRPRHRRGDPRALRRSPWDGFMDDGADELVVRSDTDALPRVLALWADRTSNVADLRGRLRGDPAILALYGPRPEMEAMSKEIGARYPRLRIFLNDSLVMGRPGLPCSPPGQQGQRPSPSARPARARAQGVHGVRRLA